MQVHKPLTTSKEQSPSWKTIISSASQQIPLFYGTRRFINQIHRCLIFVLLMRFFHLHLKVSETVALFLDSAVLLHVNDILYAIPSSFAPIQNKILYFEIFHFVHS
jgi:hypothetical protein